MIYGPSGSGKTTQLGRMARFVYKKTAAIYGQPKITRLITADPGGWKTVDPYVNLKVIHPFSLLDDRVISPVDALSKLVQGYWPFDPVTGDPLLRKVVMADTKHPMHGKEVFDFTNPKAKPTAETWKKVGGMGIEGLHSISTFVQHYLSAHPEILSELAGGAGTKNQGQLSKIQDGGDVYVQPGQASYNYVQKKMYDFVRQSCDLPLEKIVWTSLEALYMEKDKEGNVIFTEHYYPSMVGKAALRATPQWFGMLMHMETVQTSLAKEERPDRANAAIANTEVRAYLRDHTSIRDKNLYKAKTRVAWETASGMPQSFKVTLEPEKDVKVHDLCSLYELEDELQGKATAKAAADLGITL